MPNFEVFNKRSLRSGGGPKVTSQRGGIYALNQDAYEALGRPESVELLYDRDEQVMGFRAVPEGVSHAYAVRPQKNASSVLVSGRAFNQYYGITIDASRRHPATMIEDVLAVDLKSGEAVGGRTRVKAARA
jgi:hypothetical protein